MVGRIEFLYSGGIGEIVEYANQEKNALVLNELSKHACIDEITNVTQ